MCTVFFLVIFTYETCLQKLAGQPATSRAIHGRSIGRVDGLDRPSHCHFLKKPFDFLKINTRSKGPLSIFYKKHLRLFRNQPAVQIGWALPLSLPTHQRRGKPPPVPGAASPPLASPPQPPFSLSLSLPTWWRCSSYYQLVLLERAPLNQYYSTIAAGCLPTYK